MGRMMALFVTKLGSYESNAEVAGYTVDFRADSYPPKLILEQNTPPIYKMAEDGSVDDVQTKQTRITIIGLPEAQVEIDGLCTMGKKTLNKLINDGMKLVEIYLHGFMEERMTVTVLVTAR